MTNVVEELALPEQEITRDHIHRRIDDWRKRLAGLYADTAAWLSPELSAEQSGDVSMDEPLMRRVGLQPVSLPVQEFRRGSETIGRLVPQGLWIIGANGRVDLFLESAHWIIVDRGENFAAPRWQIASALARRDTKLLDRASLRKAMNL